MSPAEVTTCTTISGEIEDAERATEATSSLKSPVSAYSAAIASAVESAIACMFCLVYALNWPSHTMARMTTSTSAVMMAVSAKANVRLVTYGRPRLGRRLIDFQEPYEERSFSPGSSRSFFPVTKRADMGAPYFAAESAGFPGASKRYPTPCTV